MGRVFGGGRTLEFESGILLLFRSTESKKV